MYQHRKGCTWTARRPSTSPPYRGHIQTLLCPSTHRQRKGCRPTPRPPRSTNQTHSWSRWSWQRPREQRSTSPPCSWCTRTSRLSTRRCPCRTGSNWRCWIRQSWPGKSQPSRTCMLQNSASQCRSSTSPPDNQCSFPVPSRFQRGTRKKQAPERGSDRSHLCLPS